MDHFGPPWNNIKSFFFSPWIILGSLGSSWFWLVQLNSLIRLGQVKMWKYQPVIRYLVALPLWKDGKKIVHKRMLVEQDVQLCSTLVSRALASHSPLTAPHYTLIYSTLQRCNVAKHSTILSYYTLLNSIPHKFFWYAPDSNAAMWRLQLRTSMELNLVQCDGAVLRF